MKRFLQILWSVCGVAFLGLLIFCFVQFNTISNDIRNVTDKMTIEDIRQGLDIVQQSLDVKEMELRDVNAQNEKQ
jgi:hypothetical protein